MKKFTFIIIALAISAMIFAQNSQPIKIAPNTQTENTVKSGWEGNSSITSLDIVDPGYQYAIRFVAGELTSGDDLTIVKFNSDHENYTGYGIVNTSYTIKIYEGGSFDETTGYDVITANGSEVYTQNYTATTSGLQEVTLTTSYTIGAGEFWVSIVCNGVSAVFMGAGDPTSAYKYVQTKYDTDADEDYWGSNEYCTDAECTATEFNPWCLSVYVDDGGAYIENSDLYAMFKETGATPYATITELAITETEDLVLYPALGNSGPDITSNTVTIVATVDGTEIMNEDVDLSATNALDVGYFTYLAPDPYSVTITADELNTMSATGTFDVCLTVTYAGVDNVASNNTNCIPVTRGEVAVTECDLEAVFMTSNTDATPIASTLAITATEDITVFPAVANNGPDDANTTATIAFTIDGTEVGSQSADMTGLNNGGISPITASGYPVTAATMNTMGLTGTFDVCMSVTYDGTDAVTANNVTCVTVTRDPVNVNTNIAEAISIFPNPANNVITVANAENANIVVLNMLGEVVANINNASANQTIDINELANGTYFVKVNSEVFKINIVK
jgi:hypothetical protein